MTISALFLRPWALVGALLLHAADPFPGVSQVTLDENRHVILKVTLHSLGTPSRARSFRFALDTGCGPTILDDTVPPEFYQGGQEGDGAEVTIHRLEVGGRVRDGVPALRMNLKTGAIGRFQDEPMDGILGQSYLRNLRFTLDPAAGKVLWWPSPPITGTVLPLTWADGVPYLLATLDSGQEVPCCVDTGSIRAVELPSTVPRPAQALRQEVQHGFGGQPQPMRVYAMPNLRFGETALKNVEVEIGRRTRVGNLGQSVWLAAPTCFDFANDRIILTRTAGGTIPMTSRTPSSLPIAWDRTNGHAKLTVVYVVPGSALAHAGALHGDEVIRAGRLTGSTLTRKAILTLMDTPGPCTWTVRRDGTDVELPFE